MSDNSFPTTLAATADLLFAARIRGLAQQLAVPVAFVRAGEDLPAVAEATRPRLILLDLDARWLDAPGVIRALKAAEATRAIPIVAYVSHVREDAIAAARAAGAERVMARSAFVRLLPELLRPAPPLSD